MHDSERGTHVLLWIPRRDNAIGEIVFYHFPIFFIFYRIRKFKRCFLRVTLLHLFVYAYRERLIFVLYRRFSISFRLKLLVYFFLLEKKTLGFGKLFFLLNLRAFLFDMIVV